MSDYETLAAHRTSTSNRFIVLIPAHRINATSTAASLMPYKEDELYAIEGVHLKAGPATFKAPLQMEHTWVGAS